MSTLMFWNKQNAANQNAEAKNGKRNWLHAPDALLNGHVVYLVKFFGNTPVEQAKGIEVVKDAIRRLQFAQQMKKAETGNNPKTKKVEITISVDGVAVQEPRTQKILHQFPLHNISYCADEKGVKKFFSFIAKNNQPVQNGTINTTTNGHSDEAHECFVFISSKLASDITLTIGQAFDLAYRRFVNESGKSTELSKIQSQNKQLERTVSAYKNRLKELSELIPKSDLDRLLGRMGIRDIFEVPIENGIIENHMNGNKTSESESGNDDKLLIDTSNKTFAPMIPPRNLQNQINNTLDAFKPGGQKMEELLLNSDSDSDFDPRADEDNGNKISNDLFGFEPPKTFGQQLFTNNNNINNNNNNNNNNSNLTNGFNGSAPIASSPPLLAPPPKAAMPRRSAPTTNGTINNNNGSQDLFGSTPFTNTPTIFDAKIGSDTYITSSSLNDSVLSSSFNANLKNVPSMEVNSTAFEEDLRNPFNESGIYDMNDSRLNNVLPDINTLTDNLSKLDGILKTKPITIVDQSAQPSISQNPEKPLNPFAAQGSPNSSESKIKEKTNPFKKAETFLGPRSTNYDALRNSPEIEAMQQTSIKKEKTPSFDNIFREAASAAFSELNGGSLGPSKHANEFSNKMAGLNFNAHSSSSFGHNDQSNFNQSKTLLVDDFSLESLDPLRK